MTRNHTNTGQLVRLVVALLTGSCLAAIVLGRTAGPAPARVRSPARYAVVPGSQLHEAQVSGQIDPERYRTTFLLDPETGAVAPWRSSNRDILLHATCSPWTDERGCRQVAGNWWARSAEGSPIGTGIARLSCPDGAILDRVELNIAPCGPPCWAPGTAARIIFAASDGRLYSLTFEGSRAASSLASGRDLQPRPLAWRGGGPGPDRVWIGDPSWPTDTRLAGVIFVSLAMEPPDTKLSVPSDRQLWWLRLDLDEESIVAAGRVLEPGDCGINGSHRRYPMVAAQRDGSLVLACLVQRPRETTYQLRVTPLDFDPRTAAPRALEARERVLAERCVAMPPVFSADGQWICCLPKSEKAVPEAVRLAVGRSPDPVEPVPGDRDTHSD